MMLYNPDTRLTIEEQIKDVMRKAKQFDESIFTVIAGVRVVVTKDMDFKDVVHRINKANAQMNLTVEKLYKKYGE
jgi:predicted nuclease of predicted toxin-antitoxin system